MLVLAVQHPPARGAVVHCRDCFSCELIAQDQNKVVEQKQVMLEGVMMELMMERGEVDWVQVYVQPAVFVGCNQHHS